MALLLENRGEDIIFLSGGRIKLKDLLGKIPKQYSFKGASEVSPKGQHLNSFGEFSTTELKKVANLAAKIHEDGRMIASLLFEKSSQLNIISDDGREMTMFFSLGENTVIVTCEKA